jgi:hypothetical protein
MMTTAPLPQRGYALPEDAYDTLEALHETVRLLALLSIPHAGDPPDLNLPRSTVAHCFTDLANATQVLKDQMQWFEHQVH